METRTLGQTDVEITTVGFGCWAIVGGFTWGEQAESDSLAAIRVAYDEGVRFFDTAEMYGDGYSETLLGKALADCRDDVTIATKINSRHFEPDQLVASCEESLRRLRTDRIDLLQLHWPNWQIPFAETLGVLAKLRRQGKIRAFGLSNFGVRDLGDALATGFVPASNQLAYSLLFRAVEFELLERCRQGHLSVLCYSPLMQGLLTGKFMSPNDMRPDRTRTRHFAAEREHAMHGEAGAEAETFAAVNRVRELASTYGMPMGAMSLAWLLRQPGVGAVIAGGRHPAQVRDNVRAAQLVLPDDLLVALDQATLALKKGLGSSPDMWRMAGERIR